MRINIGRYKNRHIILTSSGKMGDIGYKPTTAMMRKSIFDMISSYYCINRDAHSAIDKLDDSYYANAKMTEVSSLSFLDICAGSGICGIEALSIGFSFVTFVEIDKARIRNIKKNLDRLQVEHNRYELLNLNALEIGLMGHKYDVVYIDPPYSIFLDVVPKCLLRLKDNDCLAGEAILFLEMPRNVQIGFLEKVHGYNILEEKVFGDSKVIILKLH